ncbi:MAG: FkbM family methyltransferase [Kiritimatiellaeota bacterium]|nr:FkbM family methyltransferase [Kiritimatiellota bacterium]
MMMFKSEADLLRFRCAMDKTALTRWLMRRMMDSPKQRALVKDLPQRAEKINAQLPWLEAFAESLQDQRSRSAFLRYVDYCAMRGRDNIGHVDSDWYCIPEFEFGRHGQEYVADCGAYTGDTLLEFMRFAAALRNGKYYAFEADPAHASELRNTIARHGLADFTEVYPCAVWHENTRLAFGGNASAASVSEQGSTVVDARKMDDALSGKPVTLIKMDIEGAELHALHGAENILRTQKPRLAIALYHKPEDLWQIPQYLTSLVPEYRYWARWHSYRVTEFVLYASAGGRTPVP